jgi:hypothetical protein
MTEHRHWPTRSGVGTHAEVSVFFASNDGGSKMNRSLDQIRISVELTAGNFELIPFNEVVVTAERHARAHDPASDQFIRDAVTVWPQCSGTTAIISGASPTAL